MCQNIRLDKWKHKIMLEAESDNLVIRMLWRSHSLAVELGRYSGITRDERYCGCGTNVQTVWHIFMECPITYGLNHRNYLNLNEIFGDKDLHIKLLSISKSLKIPWVYGVVS